MFKYVIAWFLVVYMPHSYGNSVKRENQEQCVLAYRPTAHTILIEKHAELTITRGSCDNTSEYNDIISTKDVNNSELVKLSLYFDMHEDMANTFLKVINNSAHKLKSLMIDLTRTLDEQIYNDMCLIMNITESFPQGENMVTLCLNAIETLGLKIIATDGERLFQQDLFIWDQKPPAYKDKNWSYSRRFIYADSTSHPGNDVLHISREPETQPKIYKILRKTKSGQEIVKELYDNKELVLMVPPSHSKWYKIDTIQRTYLKEILAFAIVVSLITLTATAGVLFFFSRAKQKAIVVIHCQCDRHSIHANAVQKLLGFLEMNCLMRFESPSLINSEQLGSGDNEMLLAGRSKTIDYVIFIPFPNVVDHDRSCESEAHQLCERYRLFWKKMELNLPFENQSNVNVIRSEWPIGSFHSFQFFEGLPQFVKYIHPFYLPQFLERFIRPQLWAPRLISLRQRNTFTNDHFREITDPKMHQDPVKSQQLNPFDVDPNLALNVFI